MPIDGAKWHVREILAKLEVESREDAAAWWHSYSSPSSRAFRAMHALAGLGLWKTATATAGLSLIVGVAGVSAFAFRGGPGSPASAAPASCEINDIRMETTTEQNGDSIRLRLSLSLREQEWFGEVLGAIHVGNGGVESPCRISGAISMTVASVGLLPDPALGKPGPPILTRLDEVSGNPAAYVVDAELKAGQPRELFIAEFSNWCGGTAKLVLDIAIPASIPGGPPTDSNTVTVGLGDPPPCTDASAPATLRVSPLP